MSYKFTNKDKVWKPKEIGDSITGYYDGTVEVDSTNYGIQTFISLKHTNNHTVLVKAWKNVRSVISADLGDWVSIIFKGDKQEQGYTTKLFTVSIKQSGQSDS